MKKPVKSWLIATSVASLLAAPGISQANAEVEALSKDPKNFVTWGGNYAGTRYSELDQINNKNVKNLQPVTSDAARSREPARKAAATWSKSAGVRPSLASRSGDIDGP